MKRLGLFWLILLLVIVAFYMEPVLFPPKLEVKENSDQQISNQMTTWKYQELKATGFYLYRKTDRSAGKGFWPSL